MLETISYVTPHVCTESYNKLELSIELVYISEVVFYFYTKYITNPSNQPCFKIAYNQKTLKNSMILKTSENILVLFRQMWDHPLPTYLPIIYKSGITTNSHHKIQMIAIQMIAAHILMKPTQT